MDEMPPAPAPDPASPPPAFGPPPDPNEIHPPAHGFGAPPPNPYAPPAAPQQPPQYDPNQYAAPQQPAPAYDPNQYAAPQQPAPAYDPNQYAAPQQPAPQYAPAPPPPHVTPPPIADNLAPMEGFAPRARPLPENYRPPGTAPAVGITTRRGSWNLFAGVGVAIAVFCVSAAVSVWSTHELRAFSDLNWQGWLIVASAGVAICALGMLGLVTPIPFTLLSFSAAVMVSVAEVSFLVDDTGHGWRPVDQISTVSLPILLAILVLGARRS